MSDISIAGYNALPASMRGSFHYDSARGVWTNDPAPVPTLQSTGYNPATNSYGPPPPPPGAPNTGMLNVAPPVQQPVVAPAPARPVNTTSVPTGGVSQPSSLPQQQQQPPQQQQLPPTSLQALTPQIDTFTPPATYVAPPPPAPVAPVALPQHASADPAAVQAASNAAYATAKDRIGSTGRASLDALREEMGSRGITASGLEGKETGKLINSVQGQMGDVSRQQSSEELARENAVADQVYGAGTQAANTNATIAAGERSSDQNAAITNASNRVGQLNTNNTNRRASLQTLATLRQGGIY